MKKLIFLFVVFLMTTALKPVPYEHFSKKIDHEIYTFAIPKGFCEYKSPTEEIFEFVKCYEIELKNAGEINFFSEMILIGYEKDDAKVQNITDDYLAKIQKETYNNKTQEEKDSYLMHRSYKNHNKQKSFIKNNKYIFYRTGLDDDGNKYISYESNLFLNKRYFMINWTQFLTKREKLMKEKKFIEFLNKNYELNDNNKDIIINHNEQNITISVPNFDNYSNFTNKSIVNNSGFDAIFANLLDNDEQHSMKIFRVSIINEKTDINKTFKEVVEYDGNIDSEMLNYKEDYFIKNVNEEHNIVYMACLNINDHLSILITMEALDVDEIEILNDLYKYKKQLLKDNRNIM